uniref:Uncharacterized protein n=1 Tax=Ciona intestinalis TaxID=7719 RepID=F6UCS0_CIOIN
METVAKIPQSGLYNSSDSSGGSSDEAEAKPLTNEQRFQSLEKKIEKLENIVQTLLLSNEQKDKVTARKDLKIAVLQSENEELQAKLQGLQGNCSINEPPDVLECRNPKRDKAKHIGRSFLNLLCCCWSKQTQSTM